VPFELLVVIAVALLFDFTNGFHDAANAVATSVASGAIRPRLAVAAAAVLEIIGAFSSVAVATTIGGLIVTDEITLTAILAGLAGAIAWNLFTWWRALPTSSSHALIGSMAGAAMVTAGTVDVVHWNLVLEKVVEPSVVVPILGFGLAAILSLLMAGAIGRWLDGHPRPLRGALLLSGGFVALSHGKNDAQKTMGVIALALVVSGQSAAFHVDTWVIAASGLAIAAGVYSGGWRIVRTLGRRISHLDIKAGVAAQASAAALLWRGADLGFPISTTQVITGSVLGSGASARWSHTRWSVAVHIGIAWVVTLPATCAVGALLGLVGKLPLGHAILYAVSVGGLVVLYRARRTLFAGWEENVAADEATPDPEMLVTPPKERKRKRQKLGGD
jgi:inorganic phosphate transporter, PiT family